MSVRPECSAKFQRRTTLDEQERVSLIAGQRSHELGDHQNRDVLLQSPEYNALAPRRLCQTIAKGTEVGRRRLECDVMPAPPSPSPRPLHASPLPRHDG